MNCFYFEGDEKDRGNIKDHFLVKGTKVTTKDIYNSIKRFNGKEFKYDGQVIYFEPDIENIKVLDNALRFDKTLQSVRFSKKGDNIAIYIDNEDNRNFNLKEMEEFVKEVIPNDWEVDPNQDYCIDVIYRKDGKRPTKEETVNILAKTEFNKNDFIITNIGDKKGDILYKDNGLFFPQYGTSAQDHCEKYEIPHVPVINSVDYSLILAEILREEKKEEERIPEIIPLKAI